MSALGIAAREPAGWLLWAMTLEVTASRVYPGAGVRFAQAGSRHFGSSPEQAGPMILRRAFSQHDAPSLTTDPH
jgi:hypothetical protein